jgi:methylmalonyl-CoA/ethylmalonyl-CoA epimerase
MIPNAKFHHIGIAVRSIEQTAKMYLAAGFDMTEPMFEPIQNVRICFLAKINHCVGSKSLIINDLQATLYELIEPVDEQSPVNKTLEKCGVTPYHICYEVDNMDNAIDELKKQKYMLLQKPVPTVVMNGKKVCFLFHKDVGLIELVEAQAILPMII